MDLISEFRDIFQKPGIGDVISALMVFVLPFWFAIVVGILVGWVWRPKWVKLGIHFPEGIGKDGESQQSPSFFRPLETLSSFKMHWPKCVRWISDGGLGKANSFSPSTSSENDSCSEAEVEKSNVVNVDDLKNLHMLFEKKDNGPAWIHMMKKSANNTSYQAWRRDTEIGLPQYCSRTVYEDVTPEILRDFFWDDKFRLTWDDMLSEAETLEEYPATGTTVVRWVRKFPFFCSDREYIIGRRIWQCGRTYYCVTKGVPNSSVPRRERPRRVDLYYSSWCIRAVESERDGRMTASEVVLFHHEDMGIPWEIAKLGVRQGMWGAVKKVEPALRAYQKHRSASAPLSHSALMAQITTKVDVDAIETATAASADGSSCSLDPQAENSPPSRRRDIRKMVVVVGAVTIAAALDRGLLTKAIVFGVAGRIAKAVGKL